MTTQLALFDQGQPAEGWVYIGARGGQIKIGHSQWVPRRMKQLGLMLLWTMPGSKADERALHQQFAHARIDREWFLPSPDLLLFATRPAQAA